MCFSIEGVYSSQLFPNSAALAMFAVVVVCGVGCKAHPSEDECENPHPPHFSLQKKMHKLSVHSCLSVW